jgi:Zn-dependent protease with chaperone function
VSFGASRLQEVLADRAAIHAYGSQAFASGLRHVVTRSLTFDAQTSAALKHVIEQKEALPNLYQHALLGEAPGDDVAATIRLRLLQNTDHWDSHPAPKDRIAWAEAAAFAGVCPSVEAETSPAWTLFEDRHAIETAQTAVIRQRIALHHGVRIAG